MPSIALKDVRVAFRVDAERRSTLRGVFFDAFRPRRLAPRTIEALRNVSLTIAAGERVGVIGANGAGKSTLLRVLARIYWPAHGDVRIEGRVAPLFEYATGFEMDATGWENIRTRALLLGLSPREIEARIDDIARFTELGDFLDVPVRSYSSGMLLRLAFATSTAVEPDILLLDEVMAAGDAAFQARAQARMQGLIERSSIVVFATHVLDALPNVCARSVWLDRGQLVLDGPTDAVVAAYLAAVRRLEG